MLHIDLFSGIGGFSLAAEWAGFRTIAFCENEPYCQSVLRKHWPEVPVTPRIQDFHWPQSPEPVTLITGGFPCQPFSCAGKRRGKDDDRHLWPEMFRVIKEARPRWVLGENVAGIVKMELDQVLSDLESQGYETRTVIIPACAVNAPHRRDRVWIIGYSKHNGQYAAENGESCAAGINRNQKRENEICKPKGTNSLRPNAPDPARLGINGVRDARGGWRESTDGHWQIPWPTIAASFCRVAVGLPAWIHRHRAARLKALGNAIVPQVAYEILKAIAEIERNHD